MHLINLHDNFNNVHGFFKLPSCCVQDTIQFHFWATELRKETNFWMTQSQIIRSQPIRMAPIPDLKDKKIVWLFLYKTIIYNYLDISGFLMQMFIFSPNICHCEDQLFLLFVLPFNFASIHSSHKNLYFKELQKRGFWRK